jgi:dUTP pyrophosphatase
MSDDAAAGAASVPAPATTSTTGSPPAKRIKTAVSELSSAPALTTTASTDSIDTTMATTDEIPPAPAAPVTVPLISGADIAGPVPLLVKRLSDDARVPTRGSAQSAGYDLYASRATTVPARGKVLVDTDLSIAVPVGTCT